MRALCGAIITAGALLGLGMTAMGFGTRYQNLDYTHKQTADDKAATEVTPLHLHQMDRPLVFLLVFLTIAAIIGLALTFVGLAYHHHRRHHEHLRLHGGAGGHPHGAMSQGTSVTP